MSVDTVQADSIKIFNALSEIPFRYRDRSQALKRITELGQEALNSHACTLSFVNLDDRFITVEACSGFDAEFERHISRRKFYLGALEKGDLVDYELIAKGEMIEQYDLPWLPPQGVANPKTAEKYGLRSVLAHPMESNRALIGYFSHFSTRKDRFTESEKELLEIFAHHAVVIIERFQNYQTLDRSVSILHQLSQNLLSMTTEDVLRQISRYACKLLKVPICLVWQLDEPSNTLKIVATEGPVSDEFKGLELSLNESGIEQHVARKRPSYLTNVAEEHPRYRDSAKAAAQGWVSLLSAPMHVGDEIIGMIDVYTKCTRFFEEWERELFGTFANQAALSVRQAGLLKDSRELEGFRKNLEQTAQQLLINEIQEAIDRVYIDNRDRVSVETELDETLRLIVKQCAEHTGAEACFLRLREMATNTLKLEVCYPEELYDQVRPFAHKLKIGESISGHVAETGIFYNCPDTSNDDYGSRLAPHLLLSSILCVPIKTGDNVVGTISVGSNRVGAFEQDKRQLLQSITDKVSVAIMRASLVLMVLRLAEATNNSESVAALLDKIAGFACDLMFEPVCLVFVLDKNRQGFVVKASRIPENQHVVLEDLFIRISDPEIQRFLGTKKSFHLKEAKKAEKHPHAKVLTNLNWSSMLAMPLVSEGQVMGIIEVYSCDRRQHFTVWHQRLFETLAVQASMAIENLTNRKRSDTHIKIMREMAEVHDEDELLKLLLARSLDLVGSNRGWVSKLNLQTGELKIVDSRGDPLNLRALKIGKGITGKALESERPIRVDDVQDVQSDELKGVYEKFWEDTRSELAVPILIAKAQVRIKKSVTFASKPIGVLNIESATMRAFSQADEESLWLLTCHAALCMEEIESNRKLSDLTKMETEIVGKRDWDDIIHKVLDGITRTLGYEFVNVSLVIPELNRIKSKYVTGIPKEREAEFMRLADHSVDGKDIQASVLRSKEPEVPEDNDERYDSNIFEKFHHAELIRVFIPMIVSPTEPAMGTVEAGYLKGCRKYIYEHDVQILKGFVDYTVRALEQRNRGLLKRMHHEFGLSITGIRSNASFLQRRHSELAPQLLERKFEDLVTDCEVLKLQVNQLEHILGMSFPASKPKLTTVFRDIVIKTVKQLKPQVISQGFDPEKIEYRESDVHRIKVYVDRGRLSQVVFNLLSNSIKYTEKDSSLFTIRITVEETRDSYIIVFKDWGIGIKKGLEEKIFEEGFRSTDAINRKAGSGLGLTIARTAIREMGGDLKLAGNYKPTTFHLILPKSMKELHG
jgi:GAF domain-containing protein/anti-sigma regulatory factor (Ser/Thr protein kinase)